MKKLVLVWMLLSLPAWAAETPLETPLQTQESTYVELRGAPEMVDGLVKKVAIEEGFRSASCEIISTHKDRKKYTKKRYKNKVVGILCTKPDCALMQMFNQPGVRTTQISSFGSDCAPGCSRYACPPIPSGNPLECCRKTGPFKFEICAPPQITH